MIAMPQGFVTAATALSATVLNAIWEDALLVACVWLLLRTWPAVNAATRYAVWSATLVAAFALPVATTLWLLRAPAPQVATAQSYAGRPLAAQPNAANGHVSFAHKPQTERLPAAPPAAPLRFPERPSVTLPGPVVAVVFAAWLIVAVYSLARLAVGLARLEQLKRDALPLPIEYRDAMPQWLRASKGARDVRLCVSDETDVPIAVGLFDAMILVPRSLLDRLSEGEVDQICLHELAHLRRADDWTNGAQRLIAALLGWNPAVQFACRQLDLEREVACDDWVLSFVGAVRAYALCLTKMAENAAWPRNPIPAPGVFSTRKHISLRIERLLGAGRNVATGLAPGPAAVAAAAVVAVALVVAAFAPSIAAPYVAAPAVPVVPAISPVPRVATPAAHVSSPAPRVAPRVPKAPAVPSVHAAAREALVAALATAQAPPAPRAMPSPLTVAMPAGLAHLARSYGGALLAANDKACVGCDYSGVNWSGRDMHGASYVGADFSAANLSGTNFSSASFNGVDFTKANLSGASFRGAHLTGCDFSQANLTGVDFTGARMSGCQFTGARLASAQVRAVVNGCKGCDFSGADLSGVDLSGVRANGDDFTRADLRNANLSGAILVGVDFSHARFDGANLSGATFNGCDLNGVDLTRVDLSKTKMIGTDFSGSRTPP